MIRQVSILRSLFVIVVPVFLLFGLQNTLLLPFAVDALGATEFEFGLQQAAEAIGIAAGCLVMIRWGDRLREGQWLVLSYVLMGLSGVAYAFSARVALAIMLVGLSGLVNAPSYIGRQLIIQRAVPREMRGRVNSAFFVVRDVMFVLGMAAAGIADVVDLRLVFLVSSFLLLMVGAVAGFMPGISGPAAEWRHILGRLRGIEAAPRLGVGTPASIEHIQRLLDRWPELRGMSLAERGKLAAETRVAAVPGGKVVVYRGEASDSAYFLLAGSVAVGVRRDDDYKILSTLREGDFFGEVAALTGRTRTATVITDEPSELLIIPSRVLKALTLRYAPLRNILLATMAEKTPGNGSAVGHGS